MLRVEGRTRKAQGAGFSRCDVKTRHTTHLEHDGLTRARGGARTRHEEPGPKTVPELRAREAKHELEREGIPQVPRAQEDAHDDDTSNTRQDATR